MIYKWTFPGLFFLSLFSIHLTLLIFLDCKMSFCVWPTQTGRGRSGCYLGLACVLLTALLFVFINANLKNKSTPLLPCPSPTLLPTPLQQQQSPHAHSQHHSLFVPPKYLLVLDMFLKTGNMTQPLCRANASFPIKSHISTSDGLLHILWPLKNIQFM